MSASSCGFSFIDHHSWNAYNEASDLETHIDLFEKRFGRKPSRFFGDKIYLNRDNRKTLKKDGIEIMGRALGRPPKSQSPEQRERELVGVILRISFFALANNEAASAVLDSQEGVPREQHQGETPGHRDVLDGEGVLLRPRI